MVFVVQSLSTNILPTNCSYPGRVWFHQQATTKIFPRTDSIMLNHEIFVPRKLPALRYVGMSIKGWGQEVCLHKRSSLINVAGLWLLAFSLFPQLKDYSACWCPLKKINLGAYNILVSSRTCSLEHAPWNMLIGTCSLEHAHWNMLIGTCSLDLS